MKKEPTSIHGNTKTIKEIFKVASSNLIKLFSGILVGFVLPKLIGIEDYGYYKVFTLYSTYVGLFHFGFVDGIYLKYGGKDYNELEKEQFCLFSRTLFLIELITATILSLMSTVFLSGEYLFIFLLLSLYLLFTNITGYYQIVSQITFRFNELSVRNIIQSALLSLQIGVLWLLHKRTGAEFTYKSYVIVYVLIIGTLSVWYIFTYRDITFGRANKFGKNRYNLWKLFTSGFPLTLSNLCSSLILTLDRQFVSLLFDISTYAVYAFAYNMLSLVTTASSAISVVLYPRLKQYDKDKLISRYSQIESCIMMSMFGCLLLFYPLCFIVEWYLPKYVYSLQIFRVIFPGLAISSAITILIHNYYKILDDTFNYFIKTVIIFIVSGVANAFAFFFFKTTISISIASILTMLLWYFIAEEHLIRKYGISKNNNAVYMVVMMALFYLATQFSILLFALGIYLFGYFFISLMFYHKTILKIGRQFFKRG